MQIKILGPGCRNCLNLAKVTQGALEELGLDAEIEKVTDYAEIAKFGIMSTPGLVVDDQVVVAGRVPRKAEIVELLQGK